MTIAQPPRVSDQPRPGWYLLRLVRGGPFVGAQIVQHEDGQWSCMIDGEWQGPSADPWLLPFTERIHFGGRDSTQAEIEYRIGVKRWAEIHRPDHPAANPRKRIDINDLPTVF